MKNWILFRNLWINKLFYTPNSPIINLVESGVESVSEYLWFYCPLSFIAIYCKHSGSNKNLLHKWKMF